MTTTKPPPTETIAIIWHIEDVLHVRSDLTPEQASIVLESVRDNHDATIGINWEVIEDHAESLFPE